MGVRACYRRGCDHIMCDHYSDEHGYICYDCLDELKRKAGDVTIEEFMGSKKNSGVDVYIKDAHLRHIEDTFAVI